MAAFVINGPRPRIVVEQPSADFVKASGKCAEYHRNSRYSIVHEYEMVQLLAGLGFEIGGGFLGGVLFFERRLNDMKSDHETVRDNS